MDIPIKVRVLFDTGAEANLITEKLVKRAGLKVEPLTFKVFGVTGSETLKSGIAYGKINPWFENRAECAVTKTFYVMKHLPVTNGVKFKIDTKEFEGLTLADPDFNMGGKIDMLLGIDIWAEIVRNEVIRSKSGLCAQKTEFGFALFGLIESSCTIMFNKLIVQNLQNPEIVEDMNDLMRKFWEVEDPNIKVISTDDTRAEEIYSSTFFRAEGTGRYIVKIPFIEDKINIGNSETFAMLRFKKTELQLAKNPDVRQKYNKFMQEYKDMNHMRLATRAEICAVDKYYIPHHAVAIDKKFRVVFDASAKTSNGNSLNDVQLAGPNLQEKLAIIVMRFRMNPFILSADIKKMFRTIDIHPEDVNKQLIFWRFNPQEEIQTYALTTVTYGMRASPFLALRTMLQIADDYGGKFPLAAHATRFERYMDDYMSGAETEEQLIDLYHQLNMMLKEAGMELSKWKTNSEKLVRLISAENNDFD